MYRKVVKPVFDFLAAFFGLLILSPVFIIILIINLYLNKGNPFYYSKRPGKNERLFSILKFKSMTDEKDVNGELLPYHMRLTKFGNFIRKNSLDEIPQLINVLKGDMSLIGPRPLHVEYLPVYDERQATRHDVMPGITGWAQVNGRNSITWEQRFGYDIYYVENQSFFLDVKILFLTFYKIIKKDDVYASENKNLPPFGGVKLNG